MYRGGVGPVLLASPVGTGNGASGERTLEISCAGEFCAHCATTLLRVSPDFSGRFHPITRWAWLQLSQAQEAAAFRERADLTAVTVRRHQPASRTRSPCADRRRLLASVHPPRAPQAGNAPAATPDSISRLAGRQRSPLLLPAPALAAPPLS